jgi:alkanesulfonate monooxygenase SsuD/methylene tetrahydromethanopterin reductase-like flavin-dependent oxidoreductase (luciferase family)
METRPDIILRLALLAEDLGYELISIPEGWSLDAVPLLTEIALRTRRIRIASGVLSVWSRSAATLAMTAATLNTIADGRFILGLGASTRALAEGFHDRPFSHPAATLGRTVRQVRTLLSGQPADVQAVRPIRLGQPPQPGVPIWLGAMGPATIRLTAEMADGWLPAFLGPTQLCAWRRQLDPLRASAADGTRRQLTLAAGPLCVADTSSQSARQAVASAVAWYLCSMGDIYPRVAAAQGFGSAVASIQAANPRPKPATGTVPPEAEPLLEYLAAWGSPAAIQDRLAAWSDAADIVTITPPAGLPWDVLAATLRAAAPS